MSLNLGNSCSCTESIDAFGPFRDLVLRDIFTGLDRRLRIRTDRTTGPEIERWSFTDTDERLL